MKQWLTVHKHINYEIKLLMNAEMNDDHGYRIEPPLYDDAPNTSYPTIQDAVNAINERGVLII